jgi:hypothetical protein
MSEEQADKVLKTDGRMYSKDALNWRFSKMTRRAGIGHWHAHEGRHTAVSIMSSNGVKLQDISDTVGYKSTRVTETVYRHVIVPAIRGGASVMDIFSGRQRKRRGRCGRGVVVTWLVSGAMGIRTPDLFHAMNACSVWLGPAESR